ncbi:transporter substrate-binding domain-containing protein [Bdellovibrio bacteriovorus]|uniref:transporter substrate-binding domain-containing protein n=1 Tax=Bdellovibrio bacteriovorus TaxID=959 RepID=UPI0021D1A051|nr:transporter substrate-binding domain-containing protein [Bdellovibrio bacteriovorus]UXR64497.1 transporter substrate-binding domain-containing protein [Bdellovibrio bacteriovorus]
MILPRLFFSLLLFAFLVREVPAQDKEAAKNPAACTRRYLVDISDFEPLAIRRNGRLEGLAHDLTVELQTRLGCTFIETERSLPVGIENMSSGRSDISLLGAERSGYAKGGHFVRLYTNYREMLVAQTSHRPDWKIENYIKDKNIKFAHLIGGWNMLDKAQEQELLKEGRLIGTPGPEGAFGLLKTGRVQAVLFSGIVNTHHISKLNMEKLVTRVEDSSERVEIGAFISKRRVSQEERVLLEKAFDEMKKDGSFLRIFSKYVSPQEAQHRMVEK